MPGDEHETRSAYSLAVGWRRGWGVRGSNDVDWHGKKSSHRLRTVSYEFCIRRDCRTGYSDSGSAGKSSGWPSAPAASGSALAAGGPDQANDFQALDCLAGDINPLRVRPRIGGCQQQTGARDQGTVIGAIPSSSSPSFRVMRSQRPVALGLTVNFFWSRRSGLFWSEPEGKSRT